jgi:hypothetical protein
MTLESLRCNDYFLYTPVHACRQGSTLNKVRCCKIWYKLYLSFWYLECSLQVNGTTPCVSFCSCKLPLIMARSVTSVWCCSDMEYSLSVPIVPVIVSAVVGVILGIVIGLSIAFMLATKLCSCSCSKMDGNLLHMIKGQRQKVNRWIEWIYPLLKPRTTLYSAGHVSNFKVEDMNLIDLHRNSY